MLVNIPGLLISYSEFLPDNIEIEKNICPLILLHGLTSTKDSWKYCAPIIANQTKRKVIAFDSRNHGSSGSGDLTYEILADDLKELMSSLKISKGIIVGHSMGGRVAMMFTLKYPDLVEKLIIEDMAIHVPATIKGSLQEYFKLMDKAINSLSEEISDLKGAKNVIYSIMTQQSSDITSEPDVTQIEIPLKKSETGGFEWNMNYNFLINMDWVKVGTLYKSWIEKTDKRYVGPSLFIYGIESPYKVLEDKDFLLTKFPLAKFRGIDGAKHLLHAQHAHKFCELITEFVNQQ